jgi:hypothetical protein
MKYLDELEFTNLVQMLNYAGEGSVVYVHDASVAPTFVDKDVRYLIQKSHNGNLDKVYFTYRRHDDGRIRLIWIESP